MHVLSGNRKKMLSAFLSLSLSHFPSLFLCFTPFLCLALNAVHFFSSPNSSFLLSAKGVSGPAAGTVDPAVAWAGLSSSAFSCHRSAE